MELKSECGGSDHVPPLPPPGSMQFGRPLLLSPALGSRHVGPGTQSPWGRRGGGCVQAWRQSAGLKARCPAPSSAPLLFLPLQGAPLAPDPGHSDQPQAGSSLRVAAPLLYHLSTSSPSTELAHGRDWVNLRSGPRAAECPRKEQGARTPPPGVPTHLPRRPQPILQMPLVQGRPAGRSRKCPGISAGTG